MTSPAFASPVDIDTFGEYRIERAPNDPRPLYRFDGRISTDGSTPFAAEAGRYHIYSGWFCPWAQRVVITRSLAGLEDVVSLSYVDNRRDARGWGFRETCALATPLIETYPAHLATEIDALDDWLLPAVNQGIHAAAQPGDARERVLDAFVTLDARLADRRFLLGDRITEADVRLYVSLARFDVGPNAGRGIVAGLHVFPNLWGYARDLYSIDAFGSTTDFHTFTAPGAVVPDWTEPTDRSLVHAGV